MTTETQKTSANAASAAANATAKFVLPESGVRLDDVVKDFVKQALERAGGNQSQAARLLGITRYALRYRMEKYALVSPPSSRSQRMMEAHDGDRSQ